MRSPVSIALAALTAVTCSVAVPPVLSAAPTESCSSAADDPIEMTGEMAGGCEIAFITGNATNLPATDRHLVDTLDALGYDVVLVDDDDFSNSCMIADAQIGIISSSVSLSKVPAADLAAADLPLLNLEGYLSDDLGLAVRSGEQPTGQNNIIMNAEQSASPLAAGLTGYVGVHRTPQSKHNFGEVGGDALVIATTSGRPRLASYYAYEAGTELANGESAPARRVAHFPTYDGAGDLTANGQSLLAAAVHWLFDSPTGGSFDDEIIDLRGDWHFKVYRKYSNMYQFFNFGGIDVTWEDTAAAPVPTESTFSAWETVPVPSPDYSTGGLQQMFRPGSDPIDDRTQLTDADLFPRWSEAWFVRTVDIDDDFLDDAGDTATLSLSIIDDIDVVYINGTPVGAKGFITSDGSIAPPENVPDTGGFVDDGDFRFETSYWEVPREYEFDAGLLHAGTNELAVRLYNNNSFGGIYDRPMALIASDDAVRSFKGLPTDRLAHSTAFEAVVAAQIAAIESENAAAYGATLDDTFVENERDKGEQIAYMQSLFDRYDDIQVDDANGGYYCYQGTPVYSADRTITGDMDGERVELVADDEYVEYFLIDDDGNVTERGNMSHTYAVDYVSSLAEMQGATLRYNVYLPPSYYTEPDRSYPVVYLLHGVNSTGDSFVNVDQIESRMNEWIDDGTVAEMIVVMPNSGKSSGYADTEAPRGPNDRQGPWASHIYVDILDQIETNYRAIADAGFRGLTGISMGGGGVFKIGLAHTDIYTSFASHMGAIPDLSQYADQLTADILPSLDFYIDHGIQDGTVSAEVSQRAADYLAGIGANLEFELRDGGHNSAFYMQGMPMSMAMHSDHFIANGLATP